MGMKKYSNLEEKKFKRFMGKFVELIPANRLVGNLTLSGKAIPKEIKDITEFNNLEAISLSTTNKEEIIKALERLQPKDYLFGGGSAFLGLGTYYKPIVEVTHNKKKAFFGFGNTFEHSLEIRNLYYPANVFSGEKEGEPKERGRVVLKYKVRS